MQSLWDVYLTYQSSFTHYLLFSLEVDIKLSGLKKKLTIFITCRGKRSIFTNNLKSEKVKSSDVNDHSVVCPMWN